MTEFTAQELADLGLNDLPKSKRKINELAGREGWRHSRLAREEKGIGGSIWHYDIRLLPMTARLELAAREVREYQPEEPSVPATLQSDVSEAAAARLLVCQTAERFRLSAGLGKQQGDQLFCFAFNRGEIPLDKWAQRHVKQLAPRTLMRWRKAQAQGDARGIAGDPSQNRKGTGVLERAAGGEVKKLILAAMTQNAFLTPAHLRTFAMERFGEVLDVGGSPKKMPSLRTFQGQIARWKEEERLVITALTNPDKYKGSIEFAGGRTAEQVSRLNELWEIDASPVDMLCLDGRKNFYSCIDVYSRRAVILVTDEVSSAAVALLMRTAILAFGAPEIVKTDRGSDFKSKATRRLMASLGIELDLLPAGQPKMKPHVERMFRTLQHDLIATLPGFIGHNVGERKVIEEQKTFLARRGDDDFKTFKADLSSAELQTYVSDWLTNVYEQRPHSGAGMKGQTPFLKAAQYAGPVRRIEDQRALDLLLAPIAGADGIRTVTKKGIRAGGEYYFTAAAMPGARVFCRHDPEDQGRLYLFDEDSEDYLGEAICPLLAGLDPRQVLREVKAVQRDEIRTAKDAIRKVKRSIKPRDVADAVRGKRPEVIAFERPAEVYSTPSLEAAARTGDCTKDPQFENDLQDAMTSIRAAQSSGVTPIRKQESQFDRFKRAEAIREAIENGQSVPSEDAVWFGGYSSGPEYRGLFKMYASQTKTNKESVNV